MKYLVSIILIISLFGCGFSGGTPTYRGYYGSFQILKKRIEYGGEFPNNYYIVVYYRDRDEKVEMAVDSDVYNNLQEGQVVTGFFIRRNEVQYVDSCKIKSEAGIPAIF